MTFKIKFVNNADMTFSNVFSKNNVIIKQTVFLMSLLNNFENSFIQAVQNWF